MTGPNSPGTDEVPRVTRLAKKGSLLCAIMYCAPRDATITQVDMPPIGAQGQAIEPFRAVNNAVGPFIRGFRFQVRISGNAFFYLILCLRGEGISTGREALCA